MGELFRSRDMSLIHIYMHLDAAHATLNELGKFGFVQFRDVYFLISLQKPTERIY